MINSYISCPLRNEYLHEWKSYLHNANEIMTKLLDGVEIHKHIFFQEGDYEEVLPILSKGMVLKPSVQQGSDGIAIPYKVHKQPYSNINKAKYDLSFQGSCSTNIVRSNIEKAFHNTKVSTFFKDTGCYFYEKKENDIDDGKKQYHNLIKDSKFVLCPKGGGANSERFFEALSHGRIPILLADNAKLPLEEIVNYDEFIIRIPECRINETEKYIGRFLSTKNLQQISLYAKSVFDSYLSNMDTVIKWTKYNYL